MKLTIFFLTCILMISFTSCNLIGSSNSDRVKSPEELKLELRLKEQADSANYLTISDTSMKENLVKEAGLFSSAQYDGYIVSGTITNSATIAKFKDVVLTVTLFSQTETVIDEQDFVIYEYFEPNTSKQFSFKVNPPSATSKFNVTFKSAVGAF